MGELFKLLGDKEVVIPIIQRDYAQGRKGKSGIRTKFLGDIKETLAQDKNLTLDFVFCVSSDKECCPLDGQQRLTTLWLVHWYLAFRSGELDNDTEIKKHLKKFTYKVRQSSERFCESLCTEVNNETYEKYTTEERLNRLKRDEVKICVKHFDKTKENIEKRKDKIKNAVLKRKVQAIATLLNDFEKCISKEENTQLTLMKKYKNICNLYEVLEKTPVEENDIKEEVKKAVIATTVLESLLFVSTADYIKNQTWFFSNWILDPTINSMLRTISGSEYDISQMDNIDNVFWDVDYSDYLDKLINKGKISFEVIDTCNTDNEIIEPDDQYIKMNSRGKSLTAFENFKANLEEYISSFEDVELDKLISNIDNTWTDVIWKHKAITSNDHIVDDELFEFINKFVLCEAIVNHPEISSVQLKKNITSEITIAPLNEEDRILISLSKLYDKSVDLGTQLFDVVYKPVLKTEMLKNMNCIFEYLALEDSDKDINLFDLSDIGKTVEDVNKWLLFPGKCKKDGDKSKGYKRPLDTAQIDYIYFYAICRSILYRSEGLTNTHFKEYMRIVRNLTDNSDIDNVSDMVNCIRRIDLLIREFKNQNWNINDAIICIENRRRNDEIIHAFENSNLKSSIKKYIPKDKVDGFIAAYEGVLKELYPNQKAFFKDTYKSDDESTRIKKLKAVHKTVTRERYDDCFSKIFVEDSIFGRQWAEEFEKAKAINTHAVRELEVKEAENMAFFNGSIRFLYRGDTKSGKYSEPNWLDFSDKCKNSIGLFSGKNVKSNTIIDFLNLFNSVDDLIVYNAKNRPYPFYFSGTGEGDDKKWPWKKNILWGNWRNIDETKNDGSMYVHKLLLKIKNSTTKDKDYETLISTLESCNSSNERLIDIMLTDKVVFYWNREDDHIAITNGNKSLLISRGYNKSITLKENMDKTKRENDIFIQLIKNSKIQPKDFNCNNDVFNGFILTEEAIVFQITGQDTNYKWSSNGMVFQLKGAAYINNKAKKYEDLDEFCKDKGI